MSIPGTLIPLFNSGAAATGYSISRSLRFNSSDSAYLSRTPASAGNRKKFTISFWVKRSALAGGTGPGDHSALFSAGNWSSDSDFFNIIFRSSGSGADLSIGFQNFGMATTATFRDMSAWYHFVCAVDTDQATTNNRIKLYQNGIDLNLAVDASVTQGLSTAVNNSVVHAIGAASASSFYYLNAYLADYFLIDGQALDPTSFGEFDTTTGVWVPIEYTGTYGTNGFHLDFADNASTTTIGYDAAGSNDWTANNLSVTAGAGNDSLVDVPTNGAETDTGAGGEVRGNYATWNPLFSSSFTYTNGNLNIASANSNAHGTIGVSSGKWYWEATPTTVGSINDSLRIGVRTSTGNYNGYVRNRSSDLQYGTQAGDGGEADSVVWQANTTYGLSLDCDNNQLKVYKANSLIATVTIQSGQTWFPWLGAENTSAVWVFNWGARPFAYTAPSGFKALNTANLPAPSVTKPSTVFDVVTRSFTGAPASITSLLFSPDFLWFKRRDDVASHSLFDIVRGTSSRLLSNGTNAEITVTDGVTSFDANGFTLGVDSGSISVNGPSGGSGVVWCWDAGSSTDTNTSGSITSSVRANATAGFSVVTYTGSNSNFTVGHGLGVEPRLIFIKNRSDSANWFAITKATGSWIYGFLNAADALNNAVQSANSSTIDLANASYNWFNANGDNFVAYCFAPVVGYNSISSYTGNGSSDGVFVFTGMRPRWIMIKRTDTTSNWTIIDTAREGYNVDNDPLYPNLSNAEGTTDLADILSNGFKLRSTDASVNASGGTYVYAAFAESPFNYSRAR